MVLRMEESSSELGEEQDKMEKEMKELACSRRS